MIRSYGLVVQRGASRLAFADVSVPQGGVLLVRGPSGSGKSTWLSAVAGLLAPQAGQLTVADTRLFGPDGAALRGAALDRWRASHVGLLPQSLHLSQALTVRDNLRLAQWAVGAPVDDARINTCLAALGVQALAARWPRQLSGGQAQRVALARAVLLRPKVLLADEPTASLDDDAAQQALALLLDTAARQQATLVLATHDERVVGELGRRAAFGAFLLDVLTLHRSDLLGLPL